MAEKDTCGHVSGKENWHGAILGMFRDLSFIRDVGFKFSFNFLLSTFQNPSYFVS